MEISAIYPRLLGEVLCQITFWLAWESDIPTMTSYADAVAAAMPTIEDSLREARASAQRVLFSDKDPGWVGMAAELPPKISRKQCSLILTRHRLQRETARDPLLVDTSSKDLDEEARLCRDSPTYSPALRLSSKAMLISDAECL